jgi:hypothetical protein
MPELFDVLAKGAMRLAAPQTVGITDADWTTLPFDEVTMERGGFICSTVDHTIIVPSTGEYSVHQGVDANFPGSEMIGLMTFVNGTAYSTHNLILQGRNAKPVALAWESTATLSAGDVISIRAINDASGSFDLEVQRMYFAIVKEH